MIRKQWSFSLATAFVFALSAGSTAWAGAILLSPNATGTRLNNFVVGNEFTVGSSPLLVSMLGVFDVSADGLAVAHEAGIWDLSSTTPIVSATIPSGTGGTLIDNFRYVSVTPVTLNANTTYRMGALFFASSDPFHDNFFSPSVNPGVFTTGPDAAFTAGPNRFEVSGTLVRPDSDGTVTAGRWAGANAIYEVVPEPTSFSMLLIGVSGLGFIARRKQ
jgi:hypothetical protein